MVKQSIVCVVLAACLWLLLVSGLVAWKCTRAPQSAALPAYSLIVEALDQRHEGGDPAGWTLPPLYPDNILMLMLRPAYSTLDRVAVRTFVSRDGRTWPWAVAFEPMGSGLFLLRAPVRDLPDLGPGSWELKFLVGRPEELPTAPPALDLLSPSHAWQQLRLRLTISTPGRN